MTPTTVETTVPLSRPALSVGSGPRGVQNARRWVRDVCDDMGRDDLAECAELGVSELVTNALLHGEAPILVRVRGTREHPRVEVSDASSEPPMLPSTGYDDDLEDLLVTFGRGLSIVARCSAAWGAEIEEAGKVVWFDPSCEPADEGVEGVITGLPVPESRPRSGEGQLEIELRGVPLRSFFGFQMHYRELRREVRLLALAHEDEYPLAKNLSDHFGALDRQLSEGIGAYQIDDAIRSHKNTTDLRVAIARDGAATVGRFLELLDLADAFCREERLLSLARTPEQRVFQRWFLGEFVRQHNGEKPLAWHDSSVTSRRSSVS
ncbi:MAG: ATP-binding region, ATPase domain protein [Nocardioides sp.]|jgi:anti-sigma regulatory factor (Ser/Thr protein kinase)|nr:ATP-binding region, ATPase domain protein [Nocardioides sp.]